MDDPATLLTVLQNAIGLRAARQRQAIVNFGFDKIVNVKKCQNLQKNKVTAISKVKQRIEKST